MRGRRCKGSNTRWIAARSAGRQWCEILARHHSALRSAEIPINSRRLRQNRREVSVLSAEKNRLLTQVGPGTPMGELLRRYWMPIGGASELDKNPIKPIRLMGEDLVLYKDQGGRFGLLDRLAGSWTKAGAASSSPMTISSIPARGR